jgi:hypothetical protein
LVATGQRGEKVVVGDLLGGDPSRKSSGAEFGKPLEEIANTNNDHNNNNNDHNNNNNGHNNNNNDHNNNHNNVDKNTNNNIDQNNNNNEGNITLINKK